MHVVAGANLSRSLPSHAHLVYTVYSWSPGINARRRTKQRKMEKMQTLTLAHLHDLQQTGADDQTGAGAGVGTTIDTTEALRLLSASNYFGRTEILFGPFS